LLAGVTVGLNAQYDRADVDPHGTRNGIVSGDMGSVIWYLNTIVNWVFTVEAVLKLLGEDWHPWTYFHSKWNQFDFFIVVTSWIPYFLNASGLNSLKLLRLLRLFRILRLIKFLPQLAVIVDSIIHGFDSITFIAIIMAVVYYMFAILGMMLFEKNDPYHFGYLHRAMLTLFRICTFDDWTDVMYINVYGCNNWGYIDDDGKPKAKICGDVYLTKEIDWNWAAAFYFIIFCVLGALVLLTLFIGVVTTSMEEACGMNELKLEAFDRMVERGASLGIKPIACQAFLSAFNRIDEDQSGYASVPELVSGLKSVGFKATAVEMRAALRASPFESKSPDGELDPFEFFNFIVDMAQNKPSFFFGADEVIETDNVADEAPRRIRKKNSEDISHEPTTPKAVDPNLLRERDQLLKTTTELKRQIELERSRRGASVDRPPDHVASHVGSVQPSLKSSGVPKKTVGFHAAVPGSTL